MYLPYTAQLKMPYWDNMILLLSLKELYQAPFTNRSINVYLLFFALHITVPFDLISKEVFVHFIDALVK